MNEADGQDTQKTLNPSKQGREMPFLVKAFFWDRPLFLLTLSLILILSMAFPGAKIVILMSDPVKYARLERLGLPTLMMALSVPAMFLCIFAVAFVIIVRRKLKTGSFLPSVERLNERVARSLKPQPLWKRIISSVAFCLIATSSTYGAMISQHHRGRLWTLAGIVWVCAILIIAAEFRLFAKKKAIPATPEDRQTQPESELR